MSEPLDDRRARRSLRRDADVRAVSRVTWGIAAAAIAGTVVVGGLAAGGVTDQSATDAGTAAPDAAASAAAVPASGDGDGRFLEDDGALPAPAGDGLQPPQSAPTPSSQPPAAASGGS